MYFPPEFLQEIKARIRLSELVGRYVKLRRAGREFQGLSPFTNEKTPSFNVNDQKGVFKCWSSGEGGDHFGFLKLVKGISFEEAVLTLAAEVGLDPPRQSEAAQEKARRRSTLMDVMEMAAMYYERELGRKNGHKARAYLAERGLAQETIERFRLGYAPGGWTALHDHLLQKDVLPEQMAEAGLITIPDDGRKPFDFLVNRIVFPITNWQGKVIAVAGRSLDPDQKPKYKNSPATPLFDKSNVVYNFAVAREAAFKGQGPVDGALVAVEGYMDVIALSEAGLDAAVAPMGTALTAGQIGHMWQACPEPILCFDGDRAGLNAAYKTIDTLLPLLKPGHSVRFAHLPEGRDPDDLIRAGGQSALVHLLEQALPLSELLWQRALKDHPPGTPERNAKLKQELRQAVSVIQDRDVKAFYGADVKERLEALFAPKERSNASGFAGSREKGRGNWKKEPPPCSPELARTGLANATQDERVGRDSLILVTFINHPDLLANYGEDLADLDIRDPNLDRLRKALLDAAADDKSLDRGGLRDHFSNSRVAHVADDLTSRSSLRMEPFAQPEASLAEAERGLLQLLLRQRGIEGLRRALQDAEETLAREGTDEAWEHQRRIWSELRAAEKEHEEAAHLDDIGGALST